MPLPYPIRNARGPAPSGQYHMFCPECHRVIHSLQTHGPVTPYDYNKTFCVCRGKQTGVIEQKVTIYDLEDVLTPEDAAKERARQRVAAKIDEGTKTK